jgi:hypothetical protein
MSAVILLTETRVEWNSLLAVATKRLGRNPATPADNSTRQLTQDARFLASCVSFESPAATNALTALRNSQTCQGHLHYTFLATAATGTFEEILLLNTGLTLTLADQDFEQPLFLMSGGLDVWREATLRACTPFTSQETRELFTKIIVIFEGRGLGEVWYNTERKSNPDGTLCLSK